MTDSEWVQQALVKSIVRLGECRLHVGELNFKTRDKVLHKLDSLIIDKSHILSELKKIN